MTVMPVSLGSHAPNTYKNVYERSIRDPEEFWAEEASQITWMKPWARVLDNSNPPFTKWYSIGYNLFSVNPSIQSCYLIKFVRVGFEGLLAGRRTPVTMQLIDTWLMGTVNGRQLYTTVL